MARTTIWVDGVLSVNSGFIGSITAEYAFTASPTREIDFEYDHNGLRTQKKIVENGITTTYDYTLHGKLITHLTKRVVNLDGTETIEELHFFYDAQSRPAFVEYEGETYRYIHNLQGDVVGILDSTGALVVEYRYDAWGEPTSTSGTLKTSLGILSPFRYRGYVYDKETGLYFLWSRYYYPDKARFVNVDSIVGKLGDGQPSNMYAYCDGMPIIKSDPDGHASQTALLLGGAILVVAVVAAVKIQSATKAAEKVNTAAGKKVITNKQIMKAAFNPVPESAMKEIRRRAEGWYFGEKILFSYTEQPNQYVIYDLTPRGSVVRWDHSYVEYSLNREEPLYKFLDFLVEVFEDPTFSIPGLSEWQNFGFGQLISAYASVRDITLPPTLNVSKTVIAESEGDSAYRKGFEGLY